MASNDKDPWKGNGSKQVPDLDDIVRNLQRQIGGMFRGGGSRNKRRGGISSMAIILAVFAIWMLSGVYRIDEQERGVVLRFGEHVRTSIPGLHWHIPRPIERVYRVNTQQQEQYEYRNQMLTADLNIVAIDMAVQYRRADPEAVLFNVRNPEQTLRDISESALREVVGVNTMQYVFEDGRAEIVAQARERMQEALDFYGAGLEVMSVNLEDVRAPAQVQDAFDDVTKSKQDKERAVETAQTYANEILPRARGRAIRSVRDAEAYKERVINGSLGATSRFNQLLAEYLKAPEVTRERLYLEAIEVVYADSNKVILDTEGSGNLIYLPVDKLIEQRGVAPRQPERTGTATTGSGTDAEARERESLRSRSRGNR